MPEFRAQPDARSLRARCRRCAASLLRQTVAVIPFRHE
jgi:hypothetical protein